MHPYAESAKQGATLLARASGPNPRKLVLDLIEAHPNHSKSRLFERFREEVEADDDLRVAVEWYFFNNAFEHAMAVKRNGNGARKARIEAEANRIIQQIILLDLMMPNGKPMKHCTGLEMTQFGTRFQRIAQRVGRHKLVGDVLTEDNVRKIMKL